MFAQGEIFSVADADSWSYTRTNIHEIRRIWTIDHFSSLRHEGVIVSPPFGSEPNGGNQWRLRLYPEGLYRDSETWLSVYLDLVSCEAGGVVAKFDFALLDARNQTIEMLGSDEPLMFNKGESRGFAEFLRQNVLVNNYPAGLPGNKLIICCKVAALAGTQNFSGLYSTRDLGSTGVAPSEHQGATGKTTTRSEEPPRDGSKFVMGVRKFDGSSETFRLWWNQFMEKVHDREDLSPTQKFAWLRMLLNGSGAQVIEYDVEAQSGYITTLSQMLVRYGKGDLVAKKEFRHVKAAAKADIKPSSPPLSDLGQFMYEIKGGTLGLPDVLGARAAAKEPRASEPVGSCSVPSCPFCSITPYPTI